MELIESNQGKEGYILFFFNVFIGVEFFYIVVLVAAV